MAENLVKDLITAGVHFGHRTSRWNPKMAPYIYAKKNQIHVMDIPKPSAVYCELRNISSELLKVAV